MAVAETVEAVATVVAAVADNKKSRDFIIFFGGLDKNDYLCAVNRFRSLSKSLTYRIMVVVLVMMVVITGIVYFSVRKYMVAEAEERYEGVLQRDHEEFRRRLSDVMVAAKNNLHEVERDVDHPEKVIGCLERILQVNPTIMTCALVYVPDYFPDRHRCVEIYSTRDAAGKVHSFDDEGDTIDYVDRKWFKEGIGKDTAQWSEVYFESEILPGDSSRCLLTTYSIPVRNQQGRLAALFCSDLPLEFLRYEIMDDLRETVKEYESGSSHHSYNFVIDNDGTYILHPDDERILHKVDDHVLAGIKMGERGSAMVDVDGVPSWIYYRTVKHMEWKIAIVVPREVIIRNGRILNTIILMVMLLGLVVLYFISQHEIRQTTRPLHAIALSAEEVAKGNFFSPMPHVKSVDEVKMLRDAFEVMQTSLSIYVDELKRTTAENAVFESEMATARDIQMNMIPPVSSLNSPLSTLETYGVMEPARSVGGDLYDFLIRDDRLYFCIGDVSGKGVPAALVMAVTRSLFHSISMSEEQPERIVWRINRAICENNKGNMFVTMFVGILDLHTGHLDFCNAGHEFPLVSGQPLQVRRNLPVGSLNDWHYEGQETTLQSGDTLFLYTDGLSEARNADNKLFGRQHVRELVGSHTDCAPQQLAELVKSEVRRFVGDTEQSDDLTLLIFRWHSPSTLNSSLFTHHLSLRADMDDIGLMDPFIAEVSRQAGHTAKEAKQIRLALEEALANIINYSRATCIDLDASVDDQHLTITITDDGIPFDATAESPTDLSLSPDQRPPGGLGIILLHRMTDALRYQRTDNRNVLTLIKNI